MKYDFTAIEKKWQQRWDETKPYAAVTGSDKPKFYALVGSRTHPGRDCTSAIPDPIPPWTSSPAKAHAGATTSSSR